MTETERRPHLGPPDFELGGLQIWVHGQPYPNASEPYDADWLTVTAHCGEAGASVWVSGAIVTSSAFEAFGQGCDELWARLTGKAWLGSPEPNLTVSLEPSDGLGHVLMTVEITPDHMRQEHRFEFALDQTFVFEAARQCEAIVARYPNPHAHKERAV